MAHALAIVTPLAGVWLGRYIDRKARREERDRVESFEFRKDASRILGKAGLTLRAMDPLDYAALAGLPTIELRIEIRGQEADEVRPQLSELAVRWPDAAAKGNHREAPRSCPRTIDHGRQEHIGNVER